MVFTRGPATPSERSFPHTPHPCAGVVAVTPDGSKALYNSIEGLTSLWNLENGEVIGTYESFTKKTDESEPCKLALQNVPEKAAHRLFSLQAWGRVYSSFRRDICFYWCLWKRFDTLR